MKGSPKVSGSEKCASCLKNAVDPPPSSSITLSIEGQRSDSRRRPGSQHGRGFGVSRIIVPLCDGQLTYRSQSTSCSIIF